jgi:signal transduction histidine kinase
VIADLELERRLALAAQALGYLAAGVPLAIGAIVAVLALMVGAALSVIAIGLPILIPAAALCRWLVALDRRAANRFLDAHIAPLPAPEQARGGPWRRSLEILSDRTLWRMVATLALKPPLVAGLLIVAFVPVVALAELLVLGVQGVGGIGGIDYFGPWSFGAPVGLLLLAFALPAAVLTVATLDALRAVQFAIARAVLAPRASGIAPVRELLAESLGDRSVAVAYWLPDRREFVDEVGRPVALPDPGSGRAWTAIEHDGRPVAAIVHDAALETSSELVAAAAAAASMAIDNERLKADLRARVEELRVSRLRIVQAGDEARRRIERDLHDGAQQQLVSLALELRVLRSRVDDPELRDAVDAIAERLGVAVGELRELARGIHPSVLTERGLGPAIGALAQRSALPVEVDVAVDGRMPAPVESAAYFTVAEALTNVTKYARASVARVEIARDGDAVLVVVADDGVGGVDLAAGSGLRGLRDRLNAVDGTLEIVSPPGAGTRLSARIPCDRVTPQRPPAPRQEAEA